MYVYSQSSHLFLEEKYRFPSESLMMLSLSSIYIPTSKILPQECFILSFGATSGEIF